MSRPRFTMRVVLIVMAIVAVIASHQTNWIRQRRAEIRSGSLAPMFSTGPAAPQLLGLFGERGYISLQLKERATPEEMVRLQSLFPEAWIAQPLPK